MPKTVFVICNHRDALSKHSAMRDEQELKEYDYDVIGSHIFEEYELNKLSIGMYNDVLLKLRRDVRLLTRADGICVNSDFFNDPYVLKLFTIVQGFPWIDHTSQNIQEWVRKYHNAEV